MGLSLSPHNFFKLFTPEFRDGQFLRSFHRAFQSQFSLIAVVLHDPIEHPDLERKIIDTFGELNGQTGERFLFITLADCQDQEQSSWGQVFKKSLGYFPTRGRTPVISEYTCMMMSEVLGIPLSYFPCIFITSVEGLRNMRFGEEKEGAWIGITVEDYEDVLLFLASEAREANPNFRNWNFETMMRRFTREKGTNNHWGVIDEASLALRSISRILSMNPQNSNDLNLVPNREVLKSIFLDDYRQCPSSQRGSVRLLESLCNLEIQRTPLKREGVAPIIATLEYPVRLNLQLGYTLLEIELPDYSCVIMHFAKALEIFFNRSFIQKIREEKGTRMPKFFCKPDRENRTLYVQSGEQILDLNMIRRGVLAACTLGSIYFLHKNYRFQGQTDTFEYTSALDILRKKRNPAVHETTTTEEDITVVKQAVLDIIHSEDFIYMIKVLNDLQG